MASSRQTLVWRCFPTNLERWDPSVGQSDVLPQINLTIMSGLITTFFTIFAICHCIPVCDKLESLRFNGNVKRFHNKYRQCLLICSRITNYLLSSCIILQVMECCENGPTRRPCWLPRGRQMSHQRWISGNM